MTTQNWKQQQRTRLRELRQRISAVEREQWSNAITTTLMRQFPILKTAVVGFYWPFQGEFDPRPLALSLQQQGAVLALPEVVYKGAPLRFIEWRPDASMKKDIYGIPIPDNGQEVTVTCMLIPPLGFDDNGYRLGYGSGYFDRTLAILDPRPLTIGVAFELSRLPTIDPQPHDIPMDYIVTEQAVFQRSEDGKLCALATTDYVI